MKFIGYNSEGRPLFQEGSDRYFIEEGHKQYDRSVIKVQTLSTGDKDYIYGQAFQVAMDPPAFGSDWFDNHPEKVIGQYRERSSSGKLYTDAFGKPAPKIVGTLQDILISIDAPQVKRFEHFVPAPIQQVVKAPPSKIEQAIRLTKQEQKDQQGQKGVCSEELQCLAATIRKYNTKVEYKDTTGQARTYTISEEEIKVWITFQVQKGLYDPQVIRSNDWAAYLVEQPDWKAWHEQGLVAYDGQEFIPHPLYYSGNIYEKIRDLQEKANQVKAMVGEQGYQEQLQGLEAIKPKTLVITEDERNKLHLSPFDKIWEEIEIRELSDGSPIKENTSIGSIFYFNYLWNLSNEELTIDRKYATARDIYKYWIEKDRFERGTKENEKAGIRRNTSVIGAILFDRFLLEMLTRADKAKIAGLWNSKRNNYVPIPYHKIPVGFEISRKFKGGTLAIRPAQREGVAFCNSRGTGIVAYDVGVGKTMTSILAVADGFSKGVFRRPLIAVPQKVYKKWIAEINGVFAPKHMTHKGKKVKKGTLIAEGILPQIQVNDYDNLGTKHIERAVDHAGLTLQVAAYSITMVTYEGLVKIGFSEETEQGLAERIKAALSQGESGRDQAIVEQRAEQWVDKALEGTELDIEDMGIDAIFVDEAHNFRNLFMEVKGDLGKDGEREKKHFLSGSSSTPSGRALSLFMLNSYIQDKYNLRNTFGLTATPFTNRATEIYSMMALYDYEGLKDFDVYNIAQFCITFIDETIEDTWTAAGKFKPNPVIRGYLNLPILQSIIFRSINYKTGEDANIQRPEKIILPLERDDKGVPLESEYVVQTKIQPTDLQQQWLDEITQFAAESKEGSKLYDYYPVDKSGKVDGRILIALNAARAVTFSPYALRFKDEPVFNTENITPEVFIDGSPKLKYTVECIRTVKAYHEMQKSPVSGQIIYSDRGTEWFGHIKQYLIENVGFQKSEVEIFYGKVSKGKREKIKEGFLDGSIKVIIGSSTMREGVDLQKHGSTIYVCYLDWNPTDLHQLFGRIWRFGNKFSHVRIVVPLLENSSDIFTWQKLSEKMSRLNSIWAKSDGTKMFEESELNAEELKRGLINDPEGLAQYAIEEVVSSLKIELSVVQGSLSQLSIVSELKRNFDTKLSYLQHLAQRIKEGKATYDWQVPQDKKQKVQSMELSDTKSLYRIVRAYANLARITERYTIKQSVEQHIRTAKKLKSIEDRVLSRFKLTIHDNYTPVIDEFQKREADIRAQIRQEISPENKAKKVQAFTELKAKEKADSRSIVQRVTEFQRLNYLLDCKYGIHNCDIYGRVQEVQTGQVIALQAQKPVVIQTSEYAMSRRLKAFMPRPQLKSVRSHSLGDDGPAYLRSVIKPLDEQVQAIPKRQTTKLLDGTERTSDYSIVYAHFFYSGTDWLVLEWDRNDQLFGYVILNGDVQMSKLGYFSLAEIRGLSEQMTFGPQLDFNWTPKYLPAALQRAFPSYFTKPKDPNWLPLAEMIQKGREQSIVGLKAPPKPKAKSIPVDKEEAKQKLKQAIEGITVALEFTEDKTKKDQMEQVLQGLQVSLEFL